MNFVISELSTLWPDLKLVTGRPRHPQSQGAVERLNGVIQDKLKIWMHENRTSSWSIGLNFVQWQINVSYHETTQTSPFKIMFGAEPSVGLHSTVLSENLFQNIRSEEDLDTIFEQIEAESGTSQFETTEMEIEVHDAPPQARMRLKLMMI